MLKGPLPEDSALGWYILSIPDHNLDGNHWAPLLPIEKDSLHDMAQSVSMDALGFLVAIRG